MLLAEGATPLLVPHNPHVPNRPVGEIVWIFAAPRAWTIAAANRFLSGIHAQRFASTVRATVLVTTHAQVSDGDAASDMYQKNPDQKMTSLEENEENMNRRFPEELCRSVRQGVYSVTVLISLVRLTVRITPPPPQHTHTHHDISHDTRTHKQLLSCSAFKHPHKVRLTLLTPVGPTSLEVDQRVDTGAHITPGFISYWAIALVRRQGPQDAVDPGMVYMRTEVRALSFCLPVVTMVASCFGAFALNPQQGGSRLGWWCAIGVS
jgi:hypothetical protein